MSLSRPCSYFSCYRNCKDVTESKNVFLVMRQLRLLNEMHEKSVDMSAHKHFIFIIN